MSEKSEKKGCRAGKILLGAVVVGAAAYVVYRYVKKKKEEADIEVEVYEADESDFADTEEFAAAGTAESGTGAGGAKASENAAAGGGETGASEGTAAGSRAGAAAEDDAFEYEETYEGERAGGSRASHYTSVDVKQAADRAYTTIQHSSQEAIEKMREAMGPKGGEVLQTVGEAAGEVGKTVAAASTKIIDILKSEPETPGAAKSQEETVSESEVYVDEFEAIPEPEEENVSGEEPVEEIRGSADVRETSVPEETTQEDLNGEICASDAEEDEAPEVTPALERGPESALPAEEEAGGSDALTEEASAPVAPADIFEDASAVPKVSAQEAEASPAEDAEEIISDIADSVEEFFDDET